MRVIYQLCAACYAMLTAGGGPARCSHQTSRFKLAHEAAVQVFALHPLYLSLDQLTGMHKLAVICEAHVTCTRMKLSDWAVNLA